MSPGLEACPAIGVSLCANVVAEENDSEKCLAVFKQLELYG